MKTNSQLAGTSSLGAGLPVGERQRLEVPVAAAADHLAAVAAPRCSGAGVILSTRYRDIESSSVGAADHEHDPLGVAGEVEGRLAGRVGGADDVDVVALALARLAGRRAVVDAAAGELVEPGGVEPPVGHAGRDDERARLDLAAIRRSSTACTGPRVSKPTTSRASTISAPKRETCATARWARSEPLSPFGNPR